jgi:hypothetical protein
MRHAVTALFLCLGLTTSAALAQLSISFGSPGVHIGIDVPVYPTFQRVPGYPVYYAPNVRTNYFFYDGLYWVYEGDDWYASDWYNGPWYRVDRGYVPVYLLRVPVRYYRHAPVYFRSWRADAPPRWHEHWGSSWAERRAGWDRWDRKSAPAPAPLPTYQRQYSRERYPRPEQQALIQAQNYRYQPKEEVTRQVFRERRAQAAEARQRRGERAAAPARQRLDERRGPPDHAVARGLERSGDRGPPDHARARGLERSGDRGPPDHAVARGLERSGDRGPPDHARARGRDKSEDRGPPDHAKGKAKGRDKD